MELFCSDDYVASDHAFDTTRKAGWIAAALQDSPIPGVELVEPAPLACEQILQVHSREYVDAVRSGSPSELASSSGFAWNKNTWPSVCASNGGVVAAVHAALRDGVAGSLSSGLHHARHDHGAGNCTFNGLVLGARAALETGAGGVLIVDFDAHCGGGTASLLSDGMEQLDVSTSSFDAYEPVAGTRLQVVDGQPVASCGNRYLDACRDALDAVEGGGIDLCIYNAGMDPHEDCDLGGAAGIDEEILRQRERLVFEWCASRGIPVAFVLAGGYTGTRMGEDDLVNLHLLTVDAARQSTTL